MLQNIKYQRKFIDGTQRDSEYLFLHLVYVLDSNETQVGTSFFLTPVDVRMHPSILL